jgi:cytochrome c peroxidase
MHDGRFRTLEEAVVYKTSLPDQPALGERDPRLEPYPATPEEVADLVAFLRSLTAPPVEKSTCGDRCRDPGALTGPKGR